MEIHLQDLVNEFLYAGLAVTRCFDVSNDWWSITCGHNFMNLIVFDDSPLLIHPAFGFYTPSFSNHLIVKLLISMIPNLVIVC